jgi:hypothetical protein
MLPEIVLPDLSTFLATITAMNDGMLLADGGGALCRIVIQMPPQEGGVVVEAAKPLKALGALPPDRSFIGPLRAPPRGCRRQGRGDGHIAATKEPLARKAKTIGLVDDGR